MISQEQLERAMHYLAETDRREAELKVDALRAEHKMKATEGAQFLGADGKNATERTAQAKNSQAYKDAESEYFAAVLAHQEVKNRRARAELVIELWRTESANRRMGNLT